MARRLWGCYVRPKEQPNLSLGLHLDLGEWTYRDDTWVPVYEVIATDNAGIVAKEVAGQLETFRRLVGKDPTHIDSHQHVHLEEPVRSILIEMALGLDIPPLRRVGEGVGYCGDFYGQSYPGTTHADGVSLDSLMRVLSGLPTGITEMVCHPAESVDLNSMYSTERLLELEVLCDPRARAAVEEEEITLCSFSQLPRERSRTLRSVSNVRTSSEERAGPKFSPE